MHARIARWEGGDAETVRSTLEEINKQADERGGPPEGVPAKEFFLLTDPNTGRTLAITLFETEEEMQQGHQTLNEMSPPGGGMGNRTGVEMYEVALRRQA